MFVSARTWHSSTMRSVYDAAGGDEGLLRLAEAWHARVLADEVVGHAFRHGVRPDHTRRLARTGPRRSADHRPTRAISATRHLSCDCTVATGSTRRWISGRSLASMGPYKTLVSRRTTASGRRCTTGSPRRHGHGHYPNSPDDVRQACISPAGPGRSRGRRTRRSRPARPNVKEGPGDGQFAAHHVRNAAGRVEDAGLIGAPGRPATC